MSVTITEKAAKEVKRVIEDQKFALDNTVLRIGILAGGCSGYQYKLGFDTKDAIDESKDQVTEQFGIAVAVDKRSALHLDGTQLDFFDGLEKRGFTFNNPNVTKSCGCGNSFSS
ncbi:MAG: iron-sulfur cluster assembly accessory protein [Planctomycetota bacterium]